MQGLNPGFLHCRQILYCLSHHGSSSKGCEGAVELESGPPRWLSGKESACSAGASGDLGSIPG